MFFYYLLTCQVRIGRHKSHLLRQLLTQFNLIDKSGGGGSFLREEWDYQIWEGLKLNQPETQKIMQKEAQLYLMH